MKTQKEERDEKKMRQPMKGDEEHHERKKWTKGNDEREQKPISKSIN